MEWLNPDKSYLVKDMTKKMTDNFYGKDYFSYGPKLSKITEIQYKRPNINSGQVKMQKSRFYKKIYDSFSWKDRPIPVEVSQ